PSFFALVVGIDKYTHLSHLSGCVKDADDMVDYLTNTLHVPPKNLRNLRDQKATRQAIKGNIIALASDERIHPGDPIVIFFAGHGSVTLPPTGWPSGGPNSKVQMLLPVDFDPRTNGNETAQGIFDYTLNILLSNLAEIKGDNITIIHDCCFSGSSTRIDEGDSTNPAPDIVARTIELPEDYRIMPSIDSDVLNGDRASTVTQNFQNAGMSSHVLLAACSESMMAHEMTYPGVGVRGNFTKTLLSFLRDSTARGVSLTYSEVIERLPDLPGEQYPQCEGNNRDRFLFSGSNPKRSRRMLFRITTINSVITLHGGEAQGIMSRARLAVFTSPQAIESIGELIVEKVQACTSILRKDDDLVLPRTAWAAVVKAGNGVDFPVAIPAEDSFIPLLLRLAQDMEEQRPEKRNIQAIEERLPHELALSNDNGEAVFTLMDPLCVQTGLTRLSETVSLSETDDIYSVLSSATDFFFHLRRSNRSNLLAKHIGLEAFRVERQQLTFTCSNETMFMPVGHNLCPCPGEVAMRVPVIDDDDTAYGFKLTNTTDRNLYVWVFMFDMSNLAVPKPGHFNTHACGSFIPADAPLQAHGGELTIGYGHGGSEPQIFRLNGADVDVTYLKVFITSEYVDLAYIEQKSPFALRGCIPYTRRPPEITVWDTIQLAIIQQPPGD
ncbi:hypothetical protein K488DRAFT_54322, partial [Vararia minispora EC-137]